MAYSPKSYNEVFHLFATLGFSGVLDIKSLVDIH